MSVVPVRPVVPVPSVPPVPPVSPVSPVRPVLPLRHVRGVVRRAVAGPAGGTGVEGDDGDGCSVPVDAEQHIKDTDKPAVAEVEVIRVVGWPDPVIDRLGYDPRSVYVETFWLGILGPTCTWLMRRFANGLDDDPGGFDLDMADTARALGLGNRSGRHAPFRRALARCVAFEVARREGPTTLAVRRRIPPMPRRHLLRLPTSLQAKHAQWVLPTRSSPVLEDARRRARRLALGLLASGEQRPDVELQLVRWHVHPAIAHEATQWAWAFRAHDAGEGRSGRPT